jgi:hypothetical protein
MIPSDDTSKRLLYDDASKRLLYPPRETERLLSISHAQLYRLLGDGRLAAVKIGSRSYITGKSIEAFLAALPAFRPISERAA